MSMFTLARGIELRRFTHPYFNGNVLLAQRAYLSDLLRLLDDGVRGDALEEAMKKRYPGHASAGFQLHMTATNPAWAAK